MATHSSGLGWEIPWTEEPGGLLSMGLRRAGHSEQLKIKQNLYLYILSFRIFSIIGYYKTMTMETITRPVLYSRPLLFI